MYVDASAMLAILNREADAARFKAAVDAGRPDLVTSAVTMFEAALGLARARSGPGDRRPTPDQVRAAGAVIEAFLVANDIREIAITPELGRGAVEAAARFGKAVGHPADINFGDCFVYACAKAHGAGLLYKGGDFAMTDLAR